MLIASALVAQYQNVRISPYGSANEPSICINPKNPLEIMAGSNLNFVYYSQDGGYNWTTSTLQSPEYGVWGDPVIITDTAGDFYYFHLSNPQVGNWIDRIVCQKYDRQTGSWSSGTYMGLNGEKAQDKEWAVVDQQTNTIYVTWTQFDSYGSIDPACQSNIMFSKSTDAGLSWSPAMVISSFYGDCIDSDNTTEGAVPAVGANGEVYVVWSGPQGLVFNRSLDGGDTWLEQELIIRPHISGWDISIPGIYRCNGMPVTLVDLSGGPNHGTIYVNYADQPESEDDTDIFLIKSTDGGNNWTEPVRVNDDPTNRHQFFTWMAIDQTNGYLYCVFYDRRNYPDNRTDVYLAVSSNGGESFENLLISESPFIPSEGVFFGDYNNISAVNNVVRPIWTRMDNVTRSIWTAIIDMSVGIPQVDLIPFSLEQNYPNPFRLSTIFSFKLTEPQVIYLAVYDEFGREVATLINNKYTARGKYEIPFDLTSYPLAPGVYTFGLRTPEHLIKRKMIISNN